MRTWGQLSILFLLKLCVSALANAPSLIGSSEPDWPQFRGPKRDGISHEKGLRKSWPPEGPKVLWTSTNLGRGYSSPTIVKDRIYITGDVGEELHLFALDLAGKLIWKATNGAAWKDPYPGARSTITFSGGKLFHENAHGIVAAFDAQNGKQLWTVDLLKQFNGENITWGLSECLLVDDRAVYATAGGKDALVVALDKNSGKLLWKSKPLESASYVSPILVKFADRRLIIGCSLRNLYCVDADSGELHFTQPFPTAYSVLSMMPALIGDGVFMTAPHGKGGALFKLTHTNQKIGAEEVWRSPLDTCQGGVVVTPDKIIGSFYPGRKGWAAVDPKTGAIAYQQEFIKGAPLLADQRIYALSEDGIMRLLEAAATEFKTHGEFRLARASNDAWAHPVILNGRLYLRYHETLSCYDIKE